MGLGAPHEYGCQCDRCVARRRTIPPQTQTVSYPKYHAMQLRHIWLEVSQGRGSHGDFLKSFGEAIIRADDENLFYMSGCAERFIEKYELQGYLDNYHGPTPEV